MQNSVYCYWCEDIGQNSGNALKTQVMGKRKGTGKREEGLLVQLVVSVLRFGPFLELSWFVSCDISYISTENTVWANSASPGKPR